MLKAKRLISMLLIITALAMCFTGCGQTAEDPQAPETTDAESVTSEATQPDRQTESSTPAETPDNAAPSQSPEAPAEQTSQIIEGLIAGDEGFDWSVFPSLSDEPVTLSMFYTQPPMLSAIVEVPSDMSFVYQQMEAITNVKIDFVMINMMNASTDFALMMASGSMPDIVNDALNYYNSGEQAYDEGAAINLLDYADYMPNYQALLVEYPTIKSDITTDSGLILSFSRVSVPVQNVPDAGLVIRKDWLDESGLDIPQSYDQIYEVLTAFSVNFGATAPYAMPYNVLSPWGIMAGGYGLTLVDGQNNFYVDGDEINLATVSDAYYDYLSMFTRWFDEGLIYNDFMSYTENLPDQVQISSNQTGFWFSDTPYIKTYESLLAEIDPNASLALVPDPGIDEEASGYIKTYFQSASGGFSISDNCKDIEIAVQWCDYWYNPELSQFINYGFEGVTFEYDDAGKPQLGNLILNNDLSLTARLANGVYLSTSGGFIYMWEKFIYDYSDLQMQTFDVWSRSAKDESTVTTSQVPPSVSLTAEESADITLIMSDIISYATESALKFVTGETELNESSYSDYCSVIEGMDLGGALSIMNDAYSRYLSR